MTANLDTNELVLTIVDQAHQIRRMTELGEQQNAQIQGLAAANQQLRDELEAKQVAADLALAGGVTEDAPERPTKQRG